MATIETIQKRFKELAEQDLWDHDEVCLDPMKWGGWSSSALNLVQMTFGKDSAHFQRLHRLVESLKPRKHEDHQYEDLYEVLGVFKGAKEDYEKNCYNSIEGEIEASKK